MNVHMYAFVHVWVYAFVHMCMFVFMIIVHASNIDCLQVCSPLDFAQIHGRLLPGVRASWSRWSPFLLPTVLLTAREEHSVFFDPH